MSFRRELVKKIRLQGFRSAEGVFPSFDEEPLPIVSLEDFFEGNTDYGSIGCNLIEHPGPQAFYSHLLSLRSRSDVQDVLVEIYEIEEDSNTWPFSERIYILTSASAKDVAEWLKPLAPDEIEEGYFLGKPPTAPRLWEAMQVFAAWWD